MNQDQWNIWMDLSVAARFCSNSSVILIFNQKYNKIRQYGGISHKKIKNSRFQRKANYINTEKSDNDTFKYAKEKDSDPQEELNLTSFE